MHGLSEHNEACSSGSGACASGSASAPGMELRGVTKRRGLVAPQAVLLPLTKEELWGERSGALLPFFLLNVCGYFTSRLQSKKVQVGPIPM